MVSEQYLIKTMDGEDYNFTENPFEENIIPDGFDARVVEPPYGIAGIVINNIELSFAWEPPGLHVTIEEGEPTEEEINLILKAIIKKLESKTRQKGTYIEI